MNKTNMTLTLIVGPMFAGKSDLLIRLVNRALAECGPAESIAVYKHASDNRSDGLYSRTGAVQTARRISSISQIERAHNIFLDEGQFFPDLADIAQKGENIIVSCLNLNSEGRVWPSVMRTMMIADKIIYLTARCEVCKKIAQFTAGNARGFKPATGSTYWPACYEHFKTPA